MLAPTLGGELLRWTSWRGVFAALAVLGAALIAVAAFGVPETLPVQRRRGGGVLSMLCGYGALSRDRAFAGLVLTSGMAMAAVFAYIAGASFVFQQQYGMGQQQFGLMFGAGAVGMIAATQLNPWLLHRFAPQRILLTALVIGSVAGATLLACAATGVGALAGVLIPLWVVLAAAGLALPNAPALALARHGEAAGTAAALLGAVQLGLGALAAPLVGLLGTGSVAMATVVAGGMVAATTVLLLVVRPARLDPVGATHLVAVDLHTRSTRVEHVVPQVPPDRDNDHLGALFARSVSGSAPAPARPAHTSSPRRPTTTAG